MTPLPAEMLPPQNKDAERGVLAAILRDNRCADDLLGVVGADDFYFDAHRKLFAAITDQTTAGKPADLVILREVLKQRGQHEDVGGDGYLADLWGAAPTGANAGYYARIVRDCSLRRAQIRLCMEMARDAHDGVTPADDLLATFEGRLFDLGAGHAREDVVPVREVVRDELIRLDQPESPGISTGFRELDDLTGEWREGLYIVAARVGVGKTAWMLACVLTALSLGVPALVFSLEMSRAELVRRHLSMLSGVNLRRLRGGARLTQGEADLILPAADTLAGSPLFISDAMGQTPAQIMATARRYVRRHKVGIVFLDYLQLIEPENRRVGRVEQLEVISRRLKQLSRQVGVPVVALAQVNRNATDREQERPKLSDLKGSGSIEQDCDDCYLLWRIDTDPSADVWEVGLQVAKQRNGPTGEISLSYRRSCTRFEDRHPAM